MLADYLDSAIQEIYITRYLEELAVQEAEGEEDLPHNHHEEDQNQAVSDGSSSYTDELYCPCD